MTSGRFLIIEDNRDNLDLMVYLLHAYGYETDVAMDGQAGLEAAEQQSFDLIVCDIQLPRIDGYEVVERLKKMERFQHIPIVAVSALAMVGDRERILAAGFDGYLAKPIIPERFVASLVEYLPREKRLEAPEFSIALEPDAPTEARATKATILAVDDTKNNLSVLKSLLEPSGYDVLLAASSVEARNVLETNHVDLVISDFHLADEPDFEFVKFIKSDHRWKFIPFVFISSTTNKESLILQGINEGAMRFLFRPMAPQALLANIEECLSESDGS